MAAIQKRIVKWGKRSPFSRRFNAKYDDDAIANWRLDLDKICRDLDVRCFTFLGPLLSSCSQTGLATRTDAGVSHLRHEASNSHVNAHNPGYDTSSSSLIVPDPRHNVSNANAVKPDVHVQGDPANTRTVSSRIHPNVSKNKDPDVQNRAVSTFRNPPVTEQLLITT